MTPSVTGAGPIGVVKTSASTRPFPSLTVGQTSACRTWPVLMAQQATSSETTRADFQRLLKNFTPLQIWSVKLGTFCDPVSVMKACDSDIHCLRLRVCGSSPCLKLEPKLKSGGHGAKTIARKLRFGKEAQ